MVEIYWPLMELGPDLFLSVVSTHASVLWPAWLELTAFRLKADAPEIQRAMSPQHHRPNQPLTICCLQCAIVHDAF
jgi:hypothetical protein